jgi:serine protease Do
VVGAVAVGLVFSGVFGNSPVSQEYIDQAVASALKAQSTTQLNSDGSDGTVGDTVYNQVNMVTTDYSDAIQQVVDKASASVVGVATASGSGTGVIVSADGLILTNQHVIAQEDTQLMFQFGYGEQQQPQEQDKTITVTMQDGKEYPATVLYQDETMDLAVIKIDATGLTAATLGDSDSVKVGEVTVAIGNPLGLEQTVTSGIVSALDRSVPISNTDIAEDLIQTDAAINSGNSGGALLNADGQVIGINSYKLSDGEGIGFAIPINAAKPIIEQIVANGEFKQVQVGVSVIDQELLGYTSNSSGITLDKGVYVYEVNTGSDAYAKGLKKGDVITAVNGTEVNTILEFKTQLYQHLPGDSVTLTVERDGSELQMTVTLSEATA